MTTKDVWLLIDAICTAIQFAIKLREGQPLPYGNLRQLAFGSRRQI